MVEVRRTTMIESEYFAAQVLSDGQVEIGGKDWGNTYVHDAVERGISPVEQLAMIRDDLIELVEAARKEL